MKLCVNTINSGPIRRYIGSPNPHETFSYHEFLLPLWYVLIHGLIRYVTTLNLFLVSLTGRSTFLVYTQQQQHVQQQARAISETVVCSVVFLYCLHLCPVQMVILCSQLSYLTKTCHVELNLKFFSKQLKDNINSLQCT